MEESAVTAVPAHPTDRPHEHPDGARASPRRPL